MFRKTLIAVSLGLPVAVFAAPNLLPDGSFEAFPAGSTVNQGAGTYAPVAITYGSVAAYPASDFGLAVPADNAANPANTTGDAVGTKALYFVDDNAVQTVAQSFTSAAGVYAVGFDWYLPANGFANAGNFSFTAKIDNTTVASFSGGVASVWTPVSGTTTLVAGAHTFTLTFTTTGGPSKDLNIDRAFVTAVPEPGSTGMMLAGLAVFGLIAVRRSTRS